MSGKGHSMYLTTKKRGETCFLKLDDFLNYEADAARKILHQSLSQRVIANGQCFVQAVKNQGTDKDFRGYNVFSAEDAEGDFLLFFIQHQIPSTTRPI